MKKTFSNDKLCCAWISFFLLVSLSTLVFPEVGFGREGQWARVIHGDDSTKALVCRREVGRRKERRDSSALKVSNDGVRVHVEVVGDECFFLWDVFMCTRRYCAQGRSVEKQHKSVDPLTQNGDVCLSGATRWRRRL
jgi:hypothetical protein